MRTIKARKYFRRNCKKSKKSKKRKKLFKKVKNNLAYTQKRVSKKIYKKSRKRQSKLFNKKIAGKWSRRSGKSTLYQHHGGVLGRYLNPWFAAPPPPSPLPPADAPPTLAEQHAFLDAAKNYQFDKVKNLITDKPSLLNVQPAGRWSALHQAAAAGDAGTVKWLTDHGADLAVTNTAGQTPADVARTTEIRALLGATGPPSPEASLGVGPADAFAARMQEPIGYSG